MIVKEERGHYCTECKSLCAMYEQGLSCSCGQPWETEVIYERDYPEKWVKVKVVIYKER